MSRAATAESILIKFGTSTFWVDLVIYLKRHPNWYKGLGGVGVRNFAYPIDFTIWLLTLCIALPRIRAIVSHLATTEFD